MTTRGMSPEYDECPTRSDDREDHTIKLVVMGLADSGKKTFVKTLQNRWSDMASRRPPCRDTENWFKGKTLVTEVIDTSTGRRLPFLHRLPKCDAFVLMYSMVSGHSFQSATAVRNQIVQQKGWRVPLIFVANKLDLVAEVDKAARVYRDLSVSCEWQHAHYELCAFRAPEVDRLIDHIRTSIVSNNPDAWSSPISVERFPTPNMNSLHQVMN